MAQSPRRRVRTVIEIGRVLDRQDQLVPLAAIHRVLAMRPPYRCCLHGHYPKSDRLLWSPPNLRRTAVHSRLGGRPSPPLTAPGVWCAPHVPIALVPLPAVPRTLASLCPPASFLPESTSLLSHVSTFG